METMERREAKPLDGRDTSLESACCVLIGWALQTRLHVIQETVVAQRALG